MASEFIYVFCYDISRDRARTKVATILERHGVRVQESVFEIRLNHARASRLMRALEQHCAAGDSIRAYCLTQDGRTRTLSAGGAPPPEETEFWLL